VIKKYAPLLLFIMSILVVACSDKSTDVNAKPAEVLSKVKTSAELAKELWGVDNFTVMQTSAGYMLDIRYRVLDVAKAKPLFSRKLRPFVIEEASGVRYGVPASPKIGFLRQAPSDLKANKVYFLFVANPGKKIQKGDKLTLVIGDFKIEHLIVQ